MCAHKKAKMGLEAAQLLMRTVLMQWQVEPVPASQSAQRVCGKRRRCTAPRAGIGHNDSQFVQTTKKGIGVWIK